jgi:hypothetical protein
MQNRRGFLAALGAAFLGSKVGPALASSSSVGSTVHLSRMDLLYGPPYGNGNRIVTIEEFTRETLALLVQNLHTARAVNREYDALFAGDSKIGDTLNVRRPILWGQHD